MKTLQLKATKRAFHVIKCSCCGSEFFVPKGRTVAVEDGQVGFDLRKTDQGMYEVRCDCGTHGHVTGRLLTTGKVRGCSKCMHIPEDEINYVYGHQRN